MRWFGRRDATILNENKDNASSSGAYAYEQAAWHDSRVSAFSDLHGARRATHASLAFYFLPLSHRAEPRPWRKDKERQKASVYRLLTARPTPVRPRSCIHRTSCVQQYRCANCRYRCHGYFAFASSTVPFFATRPSRCFLIFKARFPPLAHLFQCIRPEKADILRRGRIEAENLPVRSWNALILFRGDFSSTLSACSAVIFYLLLKRWIQNFPFYNDFLTAF